MALRGANSTVSGKWERGAGGPSGGVGCRRPCRSLRGGSRQSDNAGAGTPGRVRLRYRVAGDAPCDELCALMNCARYGSYRGWKGRAGAVISAGVGVPDATRASLACKCIKGTVGGLDILRQVHGPLRMTQVLRGGSVADDVVDLGRRCGRVPFRQRGRTWRGTLLPGRQLGVGHAPGGYPPCTRVAAACCCLGRTQAGIMDSWAA